jgi:cytochrome c-type biogenesis protein CcmH
LQQPVSLFVLARNPQQPGAPLAVERHQSSELPLQIDLTTDDAMLPTHTLANAQEVEIVARLSASGTPTEQSGDLFGSAKYSFAQQGEQGSVTIEINQRVP